MAMLISKFHKLIQSRLLWGGFLVMIVFSFVVWGMVWPSDLDEMEQANAAGTLDGQPVSHGEFRSAYLNAYMSRALSVGRDIPSTPENDAILRTLSWRRLATLREAGKIGIQATETELVSAIRANFKDEQGNYSRPQYDAFIMNLIRPMGFTGAQFEQHIREEIVIQKLGNLIGRQAQVTPMEIRRTFDTLMDSFVVEYAKIAVDEQQTRVSDEEARSFFDADPSAFTVPEQREVLYAAFPIADHFDANSEIADDDVMDYYELNIEKYTSTENGEDGKPRSVVKDMAEVRDEIVTALRRNAAVDKADAIATELTKRAIPGADGRIPDFSEEASKAGLAAQSLPAFSRFDVPLEDAGANFAAAVFELEAGAFDRVSVPIAGQDNVYVAYLSKIIPPRVPTFDEAKDRVLTQARRKAAIDAMIAKSTVVRDAAIAGLAKGQSFADALRDQGVDVQKTDSFTGLSGSSSKDDVIQALVQAVVAYNQGEVAEPIPLEDGIVVAFVASRQPADASSFDAYRDEIAEAIRGRRAQGLFMDWQASLLSPDRFTDLQRQDVPEDGDDAEPEETEPEA